MSLYNTWKRCICCVHFLIWHLVFDHIFGDTIHSTLGKVPCRLYPPASCIHSKDESLSSWRQSALLCWRKSLHPFVLKASNHMASHFRLVILICCHKLWQKIHGLLVLLATVYHQSVESVDMVYSSAQMSIFAHTEDQKLWGIESWGQMIYGYLSISLHSMASKRVSPLNCFGFSLVSWDSQHLFIDDAGDDEVLITSPTGLASTTRYIAPKKKKKINAAYKLTVWNWCSHYVLFCPSLGNISLDL